MKPSIFKSRKFWIAVVDCVVSLAGIWSAALLIPDQAALVVATVAALQLPVIALISGIAKEDAAFISK